MSRHSGSDPYLDPATGVLRNRLAITDEATLEQTDAAQPRQFEGDISCVWRLGSYQGRDQRGSADVSQESKCESLL